MICPLINGLIGFHKRQRLVLSRTNKCWVVFQCLIPKMYGVKEYENNEIV